MMLRTALPRLAFSLAIAAAAIWLALDRDRLDPALDARSLVDTDIMAGARRSTMDELAAATLATMPQARPGEAARR